MHVLCICVDAVVTLVVAWHTKGASVAAKPRFNFQTRDLLGNAGCRCDDAGRLQTLGRH